jgi:hypothetical protein
VLEVRLAVLVVGQEADQAVAAGRQVHIDVRRTTSRQRAHAAQREARRIAHAVLDEGDDVMRRFPRGELHQLELVPLGPLVPDLDHMAAGGQRARQEERVVAQGHDGIGFGGPGRAARGDHGERPGHSLHDVRDAVLARDEAGDDVLSRREHHGGARFTALGPGGVRAADVPEPFREPRTALERLLHVGHGVATLQPRDPYVVELLALIHQAQGDRSLGQSVRQVECVVAGSDPQGPRLTLATLNVRAEDERERRETEQRE